ncbi:hypothetical protein L210DRAFT_3500505 [Boletus edulis BED1]|uniref:Uncharacterized protein n=1 Tax=Boletus edulis BED1 TaxID=1328754 RepID=A0AAD4C4D4_BOLED|nr:hypothetical protein L210DRAFT_3506821 [Boletus edulis BED1]KAF8448867.1 hypothetical protein L210DRAFT_3500505 [Boletus edulis BED1]
MYFKSSTIDFIVQGIPQTASETLMENSDKRSLFTDESAGSVGKYYAIVSAMVIRRNPPSLHRVTTLSDPDLSGATYDRNAVPEESHSSLGRMEEVGKRWITTVGSVELLQRAEMCQWHELHRSATERGAMEHPEFEADATKENGGGCNEPEDVPILPAERDRESLEGCLHVTEWWSNSRSCHRMSEDAAETGSEEVRRWAVKRTGVSEIQDKEIREDTARYTVPKIGMKELKSLRAERKQEECGAELTQSGESIHKENAPELVGLEMDGAVMEQYWRRSGGLEVQEVRRHLPGVRMHRVISEMIPEVTSETKVIIEDVEMTLISGLRGRQKMTSGLAFRLQESGEVAARNLIGSTDRIEGRASGSNDNMHQESNEG